MEAWSTSKLAAPCRNLGGREGCKIYIIWSFSPIPGQTRPHFGAEKKARRVARQSRPCKALFPALTHQTALPKNAGGV